MCNVHCVTRYCGIASKEAAVTVVLFRCITLLIVLVGPFCAICAVLDAFYQISGIATVDLYQSETWTESIQSNSTNSTNLSVSIVCHSVNRCVWT